MNTYSEIIKLFELYRAAVITDNGKNQPWNFSLQYYNFHYVKHLRILKISAHLEPVGKIEENEIHVYNKEVFAALIAFVNLFKANLNFIKTALGKPSDYV